jgi:hypothetical protein
MRFPLFIDLGRSRLFLGLISLAHLLAALGILATPWSFLTRLFLTGALAIGFIVALRQWWATPSRLVLHADGRLEVGSARRTVRAMRCPGAMILPWLCVFSWREEKENGLGGPQTLVLFPDSAPGEKLRHLRIWLRFAEK